MTDLADGESREMKGAGAKPYILTNTGGVYSCTCPAWLHQSFASARRTCKHLKALRGDEAERLRVGGPLAKAIAAAAGASLGATPSTFPATMTAGNGTPLLLLAHRWEADVDPTGWWISEKLDGVRAFWDGTKLLSRLGNTLWAPDWFLEALPSGMPLDGELFGGRKKFQLTVSIVRRQDKSKAWREISFVIFDAPKVDAAFEGRLEALTAFVTKKAQDHLRAHSHVICMGIDHLKAELARVEALGGEGLMMRKAGSRYESGRSTTLLKVKTFHDREAIVVGHTAGAGRHLGRLGALECDLPNGKRFSVGSGFTDLQRDKPPPLGTIITFRYQELTPDGIPRFPTFVGVRHDVAWASPASAPTASAKPAAAALTRVFVKDNLSWEITLTAASHTVRRRRGLAVKMSSTSFPTSGAAWRDANTLIAAQLADGWTETL